MTSSGLYGAYTLTAASIDRVVTQKSAGAYALGKTKDDTFYISYVGRSDDDIAARLKKHVGNYDQFKFDYFASAQSAFDKECALYHDFSPPDNQIHPDRPNNSDWACLYCNTFD